jgi:MoaA/NifB/PqqE/SkfB family radical SAM enzyme
MIFDSDKILFHVDKLNDWQQGKNPYPVTVEIDLTNNCNHKCPGCCGSMKNHKKLKLDTVKKVIDDIHGGGVRGIIFTGGGEPLLHKDFEEVVRYVSNKKIKLGLITNGGLLHKKDIDLILKSFAWVRVSLDASDSDMYKKTHGMDHTEYYQVLNNIANLVINKNKNNYDCVIGVGYLTGTITNDFEKIKMFVSKMDSIGPDYIQFRPYLTTGKEDYHEYTKLNISKLKADNTAILYSKHKYDCIDNFQIKRTYDKCYGQQFASTIQADGNVTICCHSRGVNNLVLGNVNDTSFFKIWTSDIRKNIIDNLKLDWCPDLCRCDSFNRILWNMKQNKLHKEFL